MHYVAPGSENAAFLAPNKHFVLLLGLEWGKLFSVWKIARRMIDELDFNPFQTG